MSIIELLAPARVMPILIVRNPDEGVRVAQALYDGGIRVVEITLRTPAAVDAILAIRQAVPALTVGAGTVVTPGQVEAVVAAGAHFGVSPGFSEGLVRAVLASPLPFLPGVMTPSDIICALEFGFSVMKLFPATQAGGIPMLRALAGPFPELRFCPTGGIDARTAPDYLRMPNVICVGGSWLAPEALVAKGDWEAIRSLAAAASALDANSGSPAH